MGAYQQLFFIMLCFSLEATMLPIFVMENLQRISQLFTLLDKNGKQGFKVQKYGYGIKPVGYCYGHDKHFCPNKTYGYFVSSTAKQSQLCKNNSKLLTFTATCLFY